MSFGATWNFVSKSRDHSIADFETRSLWFLPSFTFLDAQGPPATSPDATARAVSVWDPRKKDNKRKQDTNSKQGCRRA